MLPVETTRTRRMPQGLLCLATLLIAWVAWLFVLLPVTAALATECRNPPDVERLLPPKRMQHEPYMKFFWLSAEELNLFRPGWARDAHVQVVGYYFYRSGLIGICKGLSGEALRIVRMHEEAHKLYHWRHPGLDAGAGELVLLPENCRLPQKAGLSRGSVQSGCSAAW